MRSFTKLLKCDLETCKLQPKIDYCLGKHFEKAENYQEALYHYENALITNEHFMIARRAVADLAFEMGEFERALEHYKNCKFMKPRVIETYDKLLFVKPLNVDIMIKKA